MGRIGRWPLLVGLACTLAAAALGLAYVMREPGADDARLARLNGTWRSRGYGWVWQIADGRVRVFDESGPYCIARPDLRRRFRKSDRDVELSADERSFQVSLYDPAYRFAFDRLDALPHACTAPADASPPAVVDALGHIFSAHYAFFPPRHVDWPALVAATRGKLTADASEQALLAELAALLGHIDDDHVTLTAKVGGKRFECNPGEARLLRPSPAASWEKEGKPGRRVVQLQERVWGRQDADGLLGDTARTTANGSIKYGLIDGDVGYLSLLSMEDFDRGDDDEAALQAALDDALAMFEDARAVIVDVSLNDGGEDRLAREIATRFAAKRTLAYSKYAGDAPGTQPQPIYLEPSDRARFTGPVYLLTSNVTVSAAEIFTLAMRALPNVTHVGEATRGSLSDVLSKRLPNGWRVTLSNEVYLDAEGKAWEGKGIPPQIALPVLTGDSDPASVHAAALRRLLARTG